LVSALDWGSRGREFESPQPDGTEPLLRQGFRRFSPAKAGGAKTVTVKGSTEFSGSSGGDLVVSVPSSSTRLLQIEETVRFSHGGQPWLDLESGFTGTIAALNADPLATPR